MQLLDVCLKRLVEELSVDGIQAPQARILQHLFRFEGVGFGELVLLTDFENPRDLSIHLRPLLAKELIVFENDRYRIPCKWELLNQLITLAEKKPSRKKAIETVAEIQSVIQPIRESLQMTPKRPLVMALR